MELIYVYIEKYKNIENQGFNLCRNHFFEYKNNELIYTKVDKKIQNSDFFPGCISNITAFIGENGSGKSTLLEFLMNFIYASSQKNRRLFPTDIKGFVIYSKNELFHIEGTEDEYITLKNINFPATNIIKALNVEEVNNFLSDIYSVVYYSGAIKSSSTIRVYEDDFQNISTNHILFEGIKEVVKNESLRKEIENIVNSELISEFILTNIFRRDIEKYLIFINEYSAVNSIKLKMPNIIRILGYDLFNYIFSVYKAKIDGVERFDYLLKYF